VTHSLDRPWHSKRAVGVSLLLCLSGFRGSGQARTRHSQSQSSALKARDSPGFGRFHDPSTGGGAAGRPVRRSRPKGMCPHRTGRDSAGDVRFCQLFLRHKKHSGDEVKLLTTGNPFMKELSGSCSQGLSEEPSARCRGWRHGLVRRASNLRVASRHPDASRLCSGALHRAAACRGGTSRSWACDQRGGRMAQRLRGPGDHGHADCGAPRASKSWPCAAAPRTRPLPPIQQAGGMPPPLAHRFRARPLAWAGERRGGINHALLTPVRRSCAPYPRTRAHGAAAAAQAPPPRPTAPPAGSGPRAWSRLERGDQGPSCRLCRAIISAVRRIGEPISHQAAPRTHWQQNNPHDRH
jgi:hypothetical protein